MKNKNSIQFWIKKFAEYHFGLFDFVKISQCKRELSADVVIIDIVTSSGLWVELKANKME